MVWDDTVSVYMDVWDKIVVDEVSGVDTAGLMPGPHLHNINIAEWMYMIDIINIIRCPMYKVSYSNTTIFSSFKQKIAHIFQKRLYTQLTISKAYKQHYIHYTYILNRGVE